MIDIARIFFLLFMVSLVSGCGGSMVTTMSGETRESMYTVNCDVTVYQTLHAVKKHGEITELCIINGTSAPGFSHTIEAAISKHKNNACKCGSNNVYVQSRILSDGWGPAQVTLIAFEYVK